MATKHIAFGPPISAAAEAQRFLAALRRAARGVTIAKSGPTRPPGPSRTAAVYGGLRRAGLEEG